MKELITILCICSVFSFSTKFVQAGNISEDQKQEIDYQISLGDNSLSNCVTDSVLIYYNNALTLANRYNIAEKKLLVYFGICKYYCYINDLTNAQNSLNKTELIFNSIKTDKEIKSDFFKTKGYYNFCKRDYINSQQAFKSALNETKDDLWTKLYLIKNAVKLNEPDQVQFYLNNIISISDEEWLSNSKDIVYTLYELNIFKKSNYLILLNQVVKKDTFNNLFDKAYCYNCIGLIYRNLEEYNISLSYLNKAFHLYARLTKRQNNTIISICNDLASIYSRINDFSKAEFYLNKILNYEKQSHRLSNYEKYHLYSSFGINCYFKNDFLKAIEYLDSANNYIQKESSNSKANLYNYYGLIYYEKGEYEESNNNFKKALSHRLKEKTIDKICLSKDYQNYSELLSRMGKSREAIEMGKKSCSLIQEVMDNKTSSVSLANSSLAKIYFENKEYGLALLTYNKAILSACSETLIPENKLSPGSDNIIYPLAYLRAIKGKASVYYSLANNLPDKKEDYYKNSLDLYSEAISVLEKIKEGYQFDNDKLQLTENENSIYNQAVEVTYELYMKTGKEEYIDIAFNFSERNKAGVLHEKLSALANASEGSPQYKLYALDQKFRKKISVLEYKIASAKTTNTKLSAWKEQLQVLYNKQEDFFDLLKTNFPDYYRSWQSPRFISVTELQKNLSDHECILEYVLYDYSLFTIIIDSKKKNIIKTPLPENFKEIFNQYILAVSDAGSNATALSGFNAFILKSNFLYSYLVSPVKNNIQNKSLIIVPDGMLNLLPFETLITKVSEQPRVDYRKLSYLILEHPVSYTNSASIYCNPLETGKKTENKILAFASGSLSSDANNSINNTRSSRTILKGAQEEVKSFNNIIDGDYYLNNSASESEFKKLASGYSILHLAMHGEANIDNPGNSRLIFETGGEGNDGYLYAWEIYNMQLHPSLVVLSACNTGTGVLRKGEGVMSLARSFLCAGCPSVVMTLWSISDLSSTNLMKIFYKNLSEGDNKSQALQHAKLQFLSQTGPMSSHPYYWAGYVVLGNKSPVIIETPTNPLIYTSTVSIAVFLLVFFYVKRKSLKVNYFQ